MMRRRSLALLFVFGCGATPAPPAAPASPAVPAEPPTAPAPRDPAPDDPAGLIGWWRGEGLCLELFANGDFELSVLDEPKVQVIGRAVATPGGDDAFELALTSARIWRARFVGPCRKIHETGRWSDSQQALGVTFRVGERASLKLRRLGADQVELCGERCAALRRDTPALSGRWRRAELTYPDRPERPVAPGELLEIAFGPSGHLWAGHAGVPFASAHGAASARFVGPDRFTITIAVERLADLPPGEVPSALGAPLAPGAARTFSARRLAEERLEVCDASTCGTLERQFDAYHYDLD